MPQCSACMCSHVCIRPVAGACRDEKKVLDLPETRVTDGCESLSGKINVDPLHEQEVLLTTEQSLQLHPISIFKGTYSSNGICQLIVT